MVLLHGLISRVYLLPYWDCLDCDLSETRRSLEDRKKESRCSICLCMKSYTRHLLEEVV